ncbi:NADP-dependent malic enzyme [Sulfurimonas gotlandica GD1]|uniref:NADP-dependent malic enzyme n=1 Tax=Sulfurimonas gotlandica (strain DSM 19862 / JCM 16533 / GD1) TaxID=929558 RepID=H1FY20_SULGG|nr:malic enzyme-like NAD(P)-binding protein [Sulfurimonas gotlandica]EHP29527.1 NADP-dependent malic enzyme [Sulfurimonas gotlandica GD1]
MSKTSTTDQEALDYHEFPQPGKISVETTKPVLTQKDLSLAYTPGVAVPCLEIEKNPENAYRYTSKKNLVAVISNGTAVLGLGNIGALASKPVMEGKGVLFKNFSGLDCFDIEVDTESVDRFCSVVMAIAPTFGGINLEDIKAPECFEIERRLVEELNIPVMHDDQHGTAVISAAGIINACKVTHRKIEDLKIVVVGAGAAAISCARLYRKLGAREIYMLDSKGVIHNGRSDLNAYKREFCAGGYMTHSEVFECADVVVGLSKPGTFTIEDIMTMANEPIVFTLANPTPEVFPNDVIEARPDAVVATGRSDFDNQVNNVLGFPFIFRGAMDVRARKINDEMKLAAAHALADLARTEVPKDICELYGKEIKFGKDYLIPKPFDKRLIVEISSAVAQAAIDSGASDMKGFDIKAYRKELAKILK